MRLGGRLQAAIEVLKDIDLRHRPVSEALKDWGVSHRFAGAGDRAAIGNIVYDVLRRRHSLLWRMDSENIADAAYGALLTDGGVKLSDIDAALDGDRFAPEILSIKQRQAWQERKIHDAPDFIRADIAKWCAPHFENLFGANWVEEASALSARPPLDLRVNGLKSSPEKVLRELSKSHAKSIEWFSQALRIAPIEQLGRHPNVQVEPAFQKGFFEIQDLGSQIVGQLVEAKSGMQVLDYCAGAGGKTLELAANMQNRGQIYAYDAEKSRLAPIFDRLRRAGVRNVQPHANIEDLAPLENQMDIVLLDAPCSGTGTWRRRPDAKWRITEAQLQRRIAEQKLVLESSLRYLKPAGRLVYITCSLFFDENDGQIASFLNDHHDFHTVDMKALWQRNLPANAPTPIFSKHGIVLSPKTTLTDGFFISILEKNA